MMIVENSLGKISFTLDSWVIDNDTIATGFLAITAHWCAEEPSLGLASQSALVAIEYMLPEELWGTTFKRVFKRLSLSPKKVGHSDRYRVASGVKYFLDCVGHWSRLGFHNV